MNRHLAWLGWLLVQSLWLLRPQAVAGTVHDAPQIERTGSTRLLWLESATVQPAWEGDNLARIVDEETGSVCLEWHQAPALTGSATLTLPGVRLEDYDAVRLQWKYIGGGSQLMIQTGGRNWYLNKTAYNPGRWNDVWLDLNLDDDRIGINTNAQGELLFRMLFHNAALKRTDEESWRRIRVRDVRLVKFPIRLTAEARAVACVRENGAIITRYPLWITNTTSVSQPISLHLDPRDCVHFTAAFSTRRFVLPPGASKPVTLTFSLPEDQAAGLPPLYYEEVPVFASIDGEPLSLTTWFRGYAVWKAGGVIPPVNLKRPYLVKTDLAGEWSDARRQAVLQKAAAALEAPVHVHDIRHGYPSKYNCPQHGNGYDLELDLINFRSHRCVKGGHVLEGFPHLDKEAGIRKHSQNSETCRTLGLAYRLTGDARYARRAADWLLAYAAKFPHWTYSRETVRSTGFQCRVGHAMLGECWWLHGFNSGYDLVADAACITDAERATITRDFFVIEADEIQTHRISANQQCEVISAAGCAAVNAENWYLAARIFSGEYGLHDQVDLTFSEDGFSLENDWAYHFAALLPLTDAGEAYEALGGSFFTPRVKRIFEAPIACSPNASPGHVELYRKAARFFHDDRFLFEEGRVRELGNSTLELAGRTTLRRGTTDRYQSIQIMWGGPTWRGGNDLLNYVTPLNTSISRINYGLKLPTPALSYQTLGGNVPEVDGLNQTGNRARQTILRDGPFPAATYAAGLDAPLYPGVTVHRTVAIIDAAYVIADRLVSSQPRRFSFAFHPGGPVTNSPGLAFTPYPAFHNESAESAYQAVTNPAVARGFERWTLAYSLSGKKGQPKGGRLMGILDGPGELIRGETWNGWWPSLNPIYLARRQAAAVACVQVLDEAPEHPVQSVDLLPVTVDGREVPRHEGLAVSLTTGNGRYLLIDCDLPGVKRAGGVETDDSLWIGPLP